MAKWDRFVVSGEFLGINHTDAPDAIKNGECQDAENLYSLERGWLRGRLGSVYYAIAEENFNYAATNVRFIEAYDTDKGTPAVGYPGVTSDAHKYFVLFVNTVSGASQGGAIAVLDHDDLSVVQIFEYGDVNTGVPNAVLSYDQVTYVTRLLPEPDMIPKGATAHGKLYIPLPANRLLELWIENSVWHCRQLSITLFDIDTVLIDARTGTSQENNGALTGSLVLSPWIAPTADAAIQTPGFSTGVGTYASPIINRADDASGTNFVDVTQNPTRDPNLPLQRFDNISVDYYARTSPITGMGWQSATDIFYRPDNQVANFDAKNLVPSKANIPESRYGYKFVWQFKDGTYSNPSSDLWVGDMLISALTTGNASDLHQTFGSPVYAEDVLGRYTTITTDDFAVNDTTCNISNAAADALPVFNTLPFFIFFTGGGFTDIAWLTAIGAHDSGGTGKTQLTFSRGKTNHAFPSGSIVAVYFDQGSVANGSGTWSSYDNANGTLAKMKALKHQLFPPTHKHYDDDCWITSLFNTDAVDGQSIQFAVGYKNNGTSVLEELGPAVDNINVIPTTYGMLEFTGASGKLYRGAGLYINAIDTDIPFLAPNGQHDASGIRSAYLSTANKVFMPNVCRIDSDGDSVSKFSPAAGAASALLVMEGSMDWEFVRVPDNNQNTDGHGYRGVGIGYRDPGGNQQSYYDTTNAAYFYSFRRLIPAERLLIDWQLSQTIPMSAVFQAPRIGLTIKAATLDANSGFLRGKAKQLLIFRTRNSLDPAFDATDYGLVANVPIPSSGDLYYFDQIKDGVLDFGQSPDDYIGIKNGISPRFIQLLGDRLYLANLTEYYYPDAPRGEIRNTDDSTPLNTSAVFEAWSSTVASAFTDPGVLTSYKYLIVYRDENGFTSGYKICSLIDRRVGSTGAYIVKGYFLGHGYGTTTNLDVYRFVPGGGSTDYILVSSLTAEDGGIFYDDTLATTASAHSLTLANFGTVQTTINSSAIRWSEPNQPSFIKGTNLQLIIPGDGETMTGLDILHSNLYAWKQNSMHRILIDISSSNPGEERLETISLLEGCIAPLTLLNDGALLFYLSNNGLRAFDGTHWHQLDEKVYNDIQTLCKLSDVANFTGVFVPRYGAYWLSVNTQTYNLTDIITQVDFTHGSFVLDVTNGFESQYPANYFPITIVNGADSSTGEAKYVAPAGWSGSPTYALDAPVVWEGENYVSIQSANTNHQPDTSPLWWTRATQLIVNIAGTTDFPAGSNVSASNTEAIIWCFDIFYAGGEVKTRDGVVTRFVMPNQKMFLRRRDGRIMSGITNNPTALNATVGETLIVLVEDGGLTGATSSDSGVDAHGNLSFPIDTNWISKLVTADTAVRVKRSRFTRIRADHYYNESANPLPLRFIERVANSGDAQGAPVADAVTRYHRAPGVGIAVDNVKFVCLNAQRGLDLQLEVGASAVGFILREIESDYAVKRQGE